MTWQAAGWVALGGALGSVLRWVTVIACSQRFGAGFPWGTLAVNVAGSFAIGVVAACAAGGVVSPSARVFLATGVLGGFTTFSAFSLDALKLAGDGAPVAAAAYTVGSVVLGLAAAYAGILATRLVVPPHL